MNYAKILLSCRCAREKCLQTLKRIERLETALDLAEYGASVQGGNIGGLIRKANDYENQLSVEWDRLSDYQNEFELYKKQAGPLLRNLSKDAQTVFRLRYIDALDWEGVAKSSGFCRSKCLKLHREAIEEFKKEA